MYACMLECVKLVKPVENNMPRGPKNLMVEIKFAEEWMGVHRHYLLYAQEKIGKDGEEVKKLGVIIIIFFHK